MIHGRIVRIALVIGLMFGAGQLMAADYSVTTVRPVSPTAFDPGNGLNLYSITAKGVELVKGSPYVLQLTDYTGQLARILYRAASTATGNSIIPVGRRISIHMGAFRQRTRLLCMTSRRGSSAERIRCR